MQFACLTAVVSYMSAGIAELFATRFQNSPRLLRLLDLIETQWMMMDEFVRILRNAPPNRDLYPEDDEITESEESSF